MRMKNFGLWGLHLILVGDGGCMMCIDGLALTSHLVKFAAQGSTVFVWEWDVFKH